MLLRHSRNMAAVFEKKKTFLLQQNQKKKPSKIYLILSLFF